MTLMLGCPASCVASRCTRVRRSSHLFTLVRRSGSKARCNIETLDRDTHDAWSRSKRTPRLDGRGTSNMTVGIWSCASGR
nr:hypothetical protein CFP56_70117 [Quercus suber]